MPTLTLTTAEANLLRDMLASNLSDLRMEIAATDLKSLRDELKDKEVTVAKLIERLKSD